MMKQWYYFDGGQQRGPIPEDQFVLLFQDGSLPGTTLVWTEGLKEWAQAKNIDNLVPSSLNPPPPPVMPGPTAFAPPPIQEYFPSGPQIRPWVRYWARYFDVILFALLAGMVLGFIYEPALEMNDTLLGILLVFVYVFVEPCILSSWGTTPGKALLKVRLRKSNGKKPNYREALSRSFNVWIRALGLGIPIIAIFTQIYAYKRLTKAGITSWDRDGDFRISHQVIGTGRVVAAIAIFISFVFLIALGKMK